MEPSTGLNARASLSRSWGLILLCKLQVTNSKKVKEVSDYSFPMNKIIISTKEKKRNHGSQCHSKKVKQPKQNTTKQGWKSTGGCIKNQAGLKIHTR